MLTPYSLPAPDFHLELSKKHQFDSFEQMRQQGSKQLETLTPGKVGILKGKKQQYRIVTESDCLTSTTFTVQRQLNLPLAT